MKKVKLSKGLFALVDNADFGRVSKLAWHAKKSSSRADGSKVMYAARRGAYMHQFVTGAPRGTVVDHINGDTLDNRRSNLRVTNKKLNGANRRKTAGTSSRFKGVSKRGGKFCARVKVDGKQKHLGCFESEENAARAYDHAACESFGGFAKTNIKACRRKP